VIYQLYINQSCKDPADDLGNLFCLIPARSLDYDQLYKGLEVLSQFEKLANSRVVDSGVLRGMNLDDIRKAGERLILQDGCKIFFQKIGKTRENLNLDVHILSYCWCADLIRSAFSSGRTKNPWSVILSFLMMLAAAKLILLACATYRLMTNISVLLLLELF
jgi:hypothetical protein